ncbi:hypothetical protein [Clostridium gasigenes]|uniref:hypothetical protein n=1 Tax=Clostridium gasigenes TaxID=94869 RepID=UPI001C0BC3D2|nr:hypothetical protein [Clostridium gasigenes]MBU3107165.1 hypothetical protein [Clostridium gasigenes]
MLFYDFEVFKEDWLVVIKDTDTRVTHKIVNNVEELRVMHEANKNNIWVGFNSRGFDQYIFKGILLDMDTKKISDHIIVQGLGGWEYSRAFNKIQLYNFDIMTDKFKGLKQLEGFMGNDIRETTVDFNTDRKLTPKEIEEVLFYCEHDVSQTMQVFINRKEEFQSQMDLIKTFNLPLKYVGKTQTQLSAIILEADKKEHDDEFEITLIDNIKIEKYKHIVEWYKNPINLDYNKSLKIDVAGVPHVFAWGGLHGAISKYNGEGIFINSDVGSFYPSLAIEYSFLSRNVRHPEKYKEIYNHRMKLKHKGKKAEQAPYKLVLNKTYGGMKDQYNNLYDPVQANNICVNGQLLLLDLIEHIEDKTSFKLIQSNTDGVMFKLNSEEDIPVYEAICKEWEERTTMTLEHDIISKVVQKDVNNYIIVMKDGKVKSKGAYVKELNPLDNDLPIVNKALMDYFIKGIAPENTINNCDELLQFQKIVKASSKYKHALHGDRIVNEKILRVFASKSRRDPGVFKVKKGKDTPDKLASTPDRCFIDNSDIKDVKIPRKLDKKWYIEVVNKRIKDFIGEV